MATIIACGQYFAHAPPAAGAAAELSPVTSCQDDRLLDRVTGPREYRFYPPSAKNSVRTAYGTGFCLLPERGFSFASLFRRTKLLPLHDLQAWNVTADHASFCGELRQQSFASYPAPAGPVDMEHPGKKPSKKARSAQYEGEAEEAVETVVEGITFRASARPYNWGGAEGRSDGVTGGARSTPKAKILPVKLRMTGISRDPPITKKARNYPTWACTKCTYRHDQVNGEASLRKCVMCGSSRRLHGAEVEQAAVSSAAAPRPPPPPPRLSNAASAAHGHSFMCEGAAAVEKACPECLTLSPWALVLAYAWWLRGQSR